ncbi:MAG: SDR family oxidoreductase [Bradyrhizobium sp.]|nr:SDR family oxidoreductase [Bradyrhizobium sp.]
MDLGLKGRKAILAGASKGIGRATAEALAAEGCDVAICARGSEGVSSALASLRKHGVKAIGTTVDVTDAEAYRAWVSGSAEALGGCDIFISFTSAGGGPPTEENWKANFELDLLPTFRGIEAALPFLERSDAGSIVAVASTNAITHPFGPQAYAAMKAAVINYAAGLSQQLAPKGIRVNSVSPGPVYFEDGIWNTIKTSMPEIYERTVQAVPLGRLGRGEELGRAIAFIASPACPFMIGTNVVIDGGFTKRVQY